jgi:hypothetical protein
LSGQCSIATKPINRPVAVFNLAVHINRDQKITSRLTPKFPCLQKGNGVF